jgi:hypothetical protein
MTIQCSLGYEDKKLVFYQETGKKVCQAVPLFSELGKIFHGLNELESFDPTIQGPISIIIPKGCTITEMIFNQFVQEYNADLTTVFAMFRKKSGLENQSSLTPINPSQTQPNSPSRGMSTLKIAEESNDDFFLDVIEEEITYI